MIQPGEYWCLLTSGICSFPKTLWSRLENFTIFCHAGFRANNLVEYCRTFFWEHPWWSRCFHESLQARKDRLISEINWYRNHGCVQNPVKHLRWSVLQKDYWNLLTIFAESSISDDWHGSARAYAIHSKYGALISLSYSIEHMQTAASDIYLLYS